MSDHGIVWCAFCEDRPAIGHMVVMKDRSREVISELDDTDGRACDLHGRNWTGVPVGANDETGDVIVLQYVHPDWDQVTEDHIRDFADEKTCVQCGDPTEKMPMWVAERILRAHPDLVIGMGYRWDGICHECAENTGCKHWDDDGPDDSETIGDGWLDNPYSQ